MVGKEKLHGRWFLSREAVGLAGGGSAALQGDRAWGGGAVSRKARSREEETPKAARARSCPSCETISASGGFWR